jgi:hypothetical protein
MFIQYDEYELLILFENEPIELNEKDSGIYVYNHEDLQCFRLSMYMSIYGQVCCLNLSYKNLHIPIFDISLTDVEYIKSKGDRLVIKQSNMKHVVVIYFKPNFSLVFEKSE